MQLRQYQRESVESLRSYWAQGYQRLAVVLPTGAGKTVVFSELIRQMRELGELPVLVIADLEELLDQAVDKIKYANPDLSVGKVQGRHNTHDTDVVVASVQTLSWRRPCPHRKKKSDGKWGPRCESCNACVRLPRAEGLNPKLIIVDECHMAAADSYIRVLHALDGFTPMDNGGVPVAGFTATLYREAGGLADVWEEVAYTKSVNEMVSMGYLVAPTAKQVVVPDLDLSKVKTVGGDLEAASLEKMMLHSEALFDIAQGYTQYAHDRKGLGFFPSVAVAQRAAEALQDEGFSAECIHGGLPTKQRHEIMRAFRNDDIQILTNCALLTKGFDEPSVSCIIMGRPTISKVLYQQTIGRGLRPSPGKSDCVILDVVGAVSRHSLASLADLEGQKSADEQGPNARKEEDIGEPMARGPAQKDPLIIGGWKDVDPLSSDVRWLKTPQGYPFVCADEKAFFVVPGTHPDMVRLRAFSNNGIQTYPGDPEDTIAAAQTALNELGRAVGKPWDHPHASWRNRAPNSRTVRRAEQWGLNISGLSAGQAEDMVLSYELGRAVDIEVERSMNEQIH